jgi:hypothetical protein
MSCDACWSVPSAVADSLDGEIAASGVSTRFGATPGRAGYSKSSPLARIRWPVGLTRNWRKRSASALCWLWRALRRRRPVDGGYDCFGVLEDLAVAFEPIEPADGGGVAIGGDHGAAPGRTRVPTRAPAGRTVGESKRGPAGRPWLDALAIAG